MIGCGQTAELLGYRASFLAVFKNEWWIDTVGAWKKRNAYAEVIEVMQELAGKHFHISEQHKKMSEAKPERDRKDTEKALAFFMDYDPFQEINELSRGLKPIRPGWPLTRGPEGLWGPKGPNDSSEIASMCVRDQYTFWPGAPILSVTPLGG